MKHLFALLLLALIATGCEKHDDVPTRPTEQTLLMYLPWSGNLTSFFLTNIDDMKKTLRAGTPEGSRVVVFFMENPAAGRLFELVRSGSEVRERELATYDRPAVTTAEGIAAILRDVVRLAPARRYGLTIGCHGMAWLPVEAPRAADGERHALPAEREHWELTDADGLPLTRWFGGTTPAYQTEITTLGAAIGAAGMHPEFILFDDCYMASVEVAYELRNVTDRLIASTCEIMSYGFPYERVGRYLLGTVDYEAVCDAFHEFYSSYSTPCGTISVTDCRQVEALAAVMRRINARTDNRIVDRAQLQALDGYSPARFFDLGDYVRQLCGDEALRDEFERQLERTVPAALRRHTPYFYAATSGLHPIRTYSGITCSDPSEAPATAAKKQTAWWQATHGR